MNLLRAFLGVAMAFATLGVGTPGAPIVGIKCESMEGAVLHIHQHLAIFDHGKPIAIPADVGQSAAAQCLYWTHTHTPDGIIHIESPINRSFTLGDFFAVWGQSLTRSNVAGATTRRGERVTAWVNGSRYTGPLAAIPLTNHLDVTLDVGTPAKKPAPFTNWNGL